MTATIAIEVSTKIARSARVRQIEGMFDVPAAEKSRRAWEHRLPLDERAWNIGLIVGPSGAGKSVLARTLWPTQMSSTPPWPRDKAIVDAFPRNMGASDVAAVLSAVGFSSPPSWLRPYQHLSNGEQFRADLARRLASEDDPIVVDEFTSFVDRTVAKIGSAAVAKSVRRKGQRFVGVTCHHDVEQWLDPDWVYEPATAKFRWRRLQPRPAISIEIRYLPPGEQRVDAWRVFGPHHYLAGDLNRTARCFLGLIDGRPAAFAAAISFCHATAPGWREHRCVCLPDFQGVGIGNAMSDYVAGVFAATGKPYRSTTVNPAMIRHRAKSPLWRMTAKPGCGGIHQGRSKQGMQFTGSFGRVVASFTWCGPPNYDAAFQLGLTAPTSKTKLRQSMPQ